MEVLINTSLKNLHTFGVDVKAKYLINIEEENEIPEIIEKYELEKKRFLVLGGGSNLLFLNDFNGVVLKTNMTGISIVKKNERDVIIEAASGVLWEDLVDFCVDNEFYGIENLALIPGTVGASPVQNIGAYGTELKDSFHSLEGYHIQKKEKLKFTTDDCQFDYRDSIFKRELKNKFLITKVRLKLSAKKKFNLNYRALKEEFSRRREESLTIKEVSDTIKKIRNSKLPDHKKLGNAGSFFKNPEISEEQFILLKVQFPSLVSFKMGNGNYKLAAGWLIEECGFKGKRIGNVGCYSHQSLVLINYGNATGIEIKEFSERIQKAVTKKFGIDLIPEVNIIQSL